MLGLWQAAAFVTGPIRWALAANFGIFYRKLGWGQEAIWGLGSPSKGSGSREAIL